MSEFTSRREHDIMGDLSGPERLHNWLMEIMNEADKRQAEVYELQDGLLGEGDCVIRWLYATGLHDEDKILIMGPDSEPKLVSATIHVLDQFRDISLPGRDADGEPAEIMLMDPRAELSERAIDIWYSTDPADSDLSKRPEDKKWQNGIHLEYDADEGWDIWSWKGEDPVITGNPDGFLEPSKEDAEIIIAILNHTERKIHGQTA